MPGKKRKRFLLGPQDFPNGKIPAALNPDPQPIIGTVLCSRGCRQRFTPETGRTYVGGLLLSSGRAVTFFAVRCPEPTCRRICLWTTQDPEVEPLSTSLLAFDRRTGNRS